MSQRHGDPTGRAALFRAEVTAAPDRVSSGPRNDGKAALFSTTPRRAGTVVVDCSGCKARSRLTVADLGLRLVLGSVWLPFQRHQHWMRCPACGHRRWCRVGWTE